MPVYPQNLRPGEANPGKPGVSPVPVRKLPTDPPEGVAAIVYGQIAALIANTVIQLFILWAAIDAFARHEYGLVIGLAGANGLLLLVSIGVLWLGRRLER